MASKNLKQTIQHKPNDAITLYAIYAEITGTFIYVYICGMTKLMADQKKCDTLGEAACAIFTLAGLVYCFVEHSGAHFNPAVSLGFYTTNHIGPKRLVMYIIAQIFGSQLAGICLEAYTSLYAGPQDFPSVLGYPHLAVGWPIWAAFVMEAVGTFFLMFVIYFTEIITTKPKNEHYCRFLIWGTIGFNIMSIGPVTGSCLNPCRMLGPAIISSVLFTSGYSYAYIYYIAPMIGSGLCGICWRFIYAGMKNGKINYQLDDDTGKYQIKVSSISLFKNMESKTTKAIFYEVGY